MAGQPVDRDPEERRRHLERSSQQYARTVREYVDELYEESWGTRAELQFGYGVRVDQAQRRVIVRLDPVPPADGGPPQPRTVPAHFGRPAWQPSEIVGRRVVVWVTHVPDGPAELVVAGVL